MNNQKSYWYRSNGNQAFVNQIISSEQRRELIIKLKLIVKQTVTCFFSTNKPLTTGNPDSELVLLELCNILEYYISHKIKSSTCIWNIIQMLPVLATKINQNDSMIFTKPVQWKDELDYIYSLSEVESEQGRARAFIRRSLNESHLSQSFEIIATHPDILKNYFEEDSILKFKEESDLFRSLLVSLQTIVFQIDYNDSDLDKIVLQSPFEPIQLSTSSDNLQLDSSLNSFETSNNSSNNNDTMNSIPQTAEQQTTKKIIVKKKVLKTLNRNIDLDGSSESTDDGSSSFVESSSIDVEQKVTVKKVVKRIKVKKPILNSSTNSNLTSSTESTKDSNLPLNSSTSSLNVQTTTSPPLSQSNEEPTITNSTPSTSNETSPIITPVQNVPTPSPPISSTISSPTIVSSEPTLPVASVPKINSNSSVPSLPVALPTLKQNKYSSAYVASKPTSPIVRTTPVSTTTVSPTTSPSKPIENENSIVNTFKLDEKEELPKPQVITTPIPTIENTVTTTTIVEKVDNTVKFSNIIVTDQPKIDATDDIFDSLDDLDDMLQQIENLDDSDHLDENNNDHQDDSGNTPSFDSPIQIQPDDEEEEIFREEDDDEDFMDEEEEEEEELQQPQQLEQQQKEKEILVEQSVYIYPTEIKEKEVEVFSSKELEDINSLVEYEKLHVNLTPIYNEPKAQQQNDLVEISTSSTTSEKDEKSTFTFDQNQLEKSYGVNSIITTITTTTPLNIENQIINRSYIENDIERDVDSDSELEFNSNSNSYISNNLNNFMSSPNNNNNNNFMNSSISSSGYNNFKFKSSSSTLSFVGTSNSDELEDYSEDLGMLSSSDSLYQISDMELLNDPEIMQFIESSKTLPEVLSPSKLTNSFNNFNNFNNNSNNNNSSNDNRQQQQKTTTTTTNENTVGIGQGGIVFIDDYSTDDNVSQSKQQYSSLIKEEPKEFKWTPPRKRLFFQIQSGKATIKEQNNLCAGCARDLSGLFTAYRYCDYSGKHYCTHCHDKSVFYVPGRIITNWDFKQHAMSKFYIEFLKEIEKDPLFDLSTLNAKLYKHQELLRIRNLRKQMFFIKDFLLTCQEGQKLLSLIGDGNEYLYNDIEYFSLNDLIHHKTLLKNLRPLVAKWLDHVEKCSMCLAKGSICEFCNDPNPIFPYHISRVSQCNQCKSFHHKSCWNKNSLKCPKCLRVAKRRILSNFDQARKMEKSNTFINPSN
ncbi:RUN domain-containing protein [Tieghemostelium lacteum]|uniref:RUN domain-containing protein n=1 Tax=Tieghemostelium lacteum TaxID=361077 RepID=A0A151ZHL5_TIELA|nr:RUN domain-containing protein [Tieghemostelium lacteum]|eukprot:KYQ93481.1 RUN domain-containing protein [Tieghemostelium lacteum]